MAIKTEIRADNNGYLYKMEATSKTHADVVIIVDAEIGGHGCLYGIKLPVMATKDMEWEGKPQAPELYDVLKVLNQILSDFHCDCTIVKGQLQKL